MLHSGAVMFLLQNDYCKYQWLLVKIKQILQKFQFMRWILNNFETTLLLFCIHPQSLTLNHTLTTIVKVLLRYPWRTTCDSENTSFPSTHFYVHFLIRKAGWKLQHNFSPETSNTRRNVQERHPAINPETHYLHLCQHVAWESKKYGLL